MSLVAYGASDDSDQSDTEDNNDEQLSNEKKSVVDQISDDEEYQAVTVSSSSTVKSDYPLNNNFSLTGISSIHSHHDLPPPQTREDVTVEETELEEEVRQKPSELADAPKPPSKRSKQPVKITIPSLDEIPEDDEGDAKRKAVSLPKPSGLFSLLPAPIHSAKKEINRPLIPHSVSKKPPPSKPVVQAKSVSSSTQDSANQSNSSRKSDSVNKHMTAFINYDSDDDEDETSSSQNFFSLGSSDNKETDSVSSTTDNNETNVTMIAAENKKGKDSSAEEMSSSPPQEEATVRPEPGLMNDSPLDFGNASRFSSWSSASSSYLGGLIPNHQPQASSTYYSSYPQSSPMQSSVQYNMVDAYGGQDPEADGTEVPSDDLQQVMNDKEFQKLQGKRKRGMEEVISFVDAKVDDYVDPTEVSKYITEETEYQSKKNKDDMPTSQQKRKKQITYLAFQAKEKELELKNTWSQNKLTRRQTQAKYGF